LYGQALTRDPGDEAAARRDVQALADFLATHPDAGFTAWESVPFRGLLSALRPSFPSLAAQVLRLGYLSPAAALDSAVRALVVVGDDRGLLLTDPADPNALRWLSMPRPDMLRLVATARDEAVTGSEPTTLAALRALLLPAGGVCPGELIVASDGVLEEAPLRILFALGTPTDARLPAIIQLTRRRLRGPVTSSPTIASLADAWRDLPRAHDEVTKDEAKLFLRGNAVTAAALASVGETGLLHVGVHAQREYGLPQLLLADGALGPLEIGAMSFPGGPVVLLSGCGTSASATRSGVERSLADAFLRAGARAVIATRWAVEDREMYDAVRAIIGRWPFASPSRVVADVSHELRVAGAPARVWGALAVYKPQLVEGT
jgi:hypothetical protein